MSSPRVPLSKRFRAELRITTRAVVTVEGCSPLDALRTIHNLGASQLFEMCVDGEPVTLLSSNVEVSPIPVEVRS